MQATGIVYHKDCIEFLKEFGDKSIDHVFTSPPYNRKRNDKYDHYDDTLIDYYGLIKSVIDESLRIATGYVFINIQKNYYNKKEVFDLIGEFSSKIQEIIIWEKSNPMPASGFSITNAYEFFIILGDKPLKSNKTYTKNIITTSVHSKMPSNHKAVMKPEVCDWFIENFTKIGEMVLDPFTGIGTTGVSCVSKGRNFKGSELSEIYCTEANDNIAKATLT